MLLPCSFSAPSCILNFISALDSPSVLPPSPPRSSLCPLCPSHAFSALHVCFAVLWRIQCMFFSVPNRPIRPHPPCRHADGCHSLRGERQSCRELAADTGGRKGQSAVRPVRAQIRALGVRRWGRNIMHGMLCEEQGRLSAPPCLPSLSIASSLYVPFISLCCTTRLPPR